MLSQCVFADEDLGGNCVANLPLASDVHRKVARTCTALVEGLSTFSAAFHFCHLETWNPSGLHTVIDLL